MSPIGTTLTGEYGTSEIVGYSGHRRVVVYRPHSVHPSEPWAREVRESHFCLDHRDVTPVVNTYAAQLGKTGPHVRGYDSRCAHCYLGHSHTVALHDAGVGAAAAPARP